MDFFEDPVSRTVDIVEATRRLRNGICKVRGLRLIGDSVLGVIVFTVEYGPFLVKEMGDYLEGEGWLIMTVEHPLALKVCLTPPMYARVDELLTDIRKSFLRVRSDHENVAMSHGYETGLAFFLVQDKANSVNESDSFTREGVPLFPGIIRFPDAVLEELFGNVCGR